MINRESLRANLQIAPHQPATALFRAVELSHLIESRVLPSEGYGFDLGCGDGKITNLIIERAGLHWRLVGLDPDPNETALAAQMSFYTRIHTASAASVDEPNDSFDFVFSNSVLEHIPNLSPVLAEVNRILRLGGRFIFTVPSHLFHDFLVGPKFFGRIATGKTDRQEYLKSLDSRLAHFRYWDEVTWRQELKTAGLELQHASYYLSRSELKRWEFISNATSGLLLRLTGKPGSPMDAQRKIGIRKSKPPFWIRFVGQIIGRCAAVGLRNSNERTGQGEGGACMLGVAVKLQ